MDRIDRAVLDDLLTHPCPLTVRERDALRALMAWADEAREAIDGIRFCDKPDNAEELVAAWSAKEPA